MKLFEAEKVWDDPAAIIITTMENEDINHPRQLEWLLRDNGFTRKEAMLLISGGWSKFYQHRQDYYPLRRGRFYMFLRKIGLIRK